MALCDLANTVLEDGDTARARALHEESLARRRELGDRRGMALSLVGLGQVALSGGDRRIASASFAQSLTISRDVGDQYGIVHSLEGFAALAAAQGRAERALRLVGAAAGLREVIGAPPSPTGAARLRRQLKPAHAALGRARAAGAVAQGRLMPLDQAITLALAGQADQARLAGGARMLDIRDRGLPRIGDQNVEAVRAALAAAGVPIVAEDTGGGRGRTVWFDPREAGRIRVRTVGVEERHL
jgi:hypothetical protein